MKIHLQEKPAKSTTASVPLEKPRIFATQQETNVASTSSNQLDDSMRFLKVLLFRVKSNIHTSSIGCSRNVWPISQLCKQSGTKQKVHSCGDAKIKFTRVFTRVIYFPIKTYIVTKKQGIFHYVVLTAFRQLISVVPFLENSLNSLKFTLNYEMST